MATETVDMTFSVSMSLNKLSGRITNKLMPTYENNANY